MHLRKGVIITIFAEDENHHHDGIDKKSDGDFINREEYASVVDSILSDDDKEQRYF